MSSSVLLNLAIAGLVLGLGAIWPTVTVPSRWRERERSRIRRTRQQLEARALKRLRDLRAELDQVFHEADEGRDFFLRRVDPQAVAEPVGEYVRMINRQTRLDRLSGRVRKLSRVDFWFLIAFDALMFGAIVLGVMFGSRLPAPGALALIVAGGVFVVGGAIFMFLVFAVRSIEAIHAEVDDGEQDPSFDDLLGADE